MNIPYMEALCSIADLYVRNENGDKSHWHRMTRLDAEIFIAVSISMNLGIEEINKRYRESANL